MVATLGPETESLDNTSASTTLSKLSEESESSQADENEPTDARCRFDYLVNVCPESVTLLTGLHAISQMMTVE